MIRFHIRRAALAGAALAAAGLLAACGQSSSATNIVLEGPTDQVEALVTRHQLMAQPVQAHVEKLPDGRERAAFRRAKGLPAGELIVLGEAAAKAGISFEYSSGTQWGSGSPGDAPAQAAPKPKGPIV